MRRERTVLVRVCSVPYCKKTLLPGERQHRGLCVSCYNVAAELVRSGQTNWEKLERAGKAMPLHTIKEWFLAS